jgi:tripartite-type tricarboxylate transporter receptor subunit TctC
MRFTKRALLGAWIGAAAALALPAAAQTFPTKPVRITTPFPAGAGPEGVLRVLAEKLQKKWGQPVIIENKPGANGFIAIDSWKRAATNPDGHELLHVDNVHLTAYPHLFKKLPYDAAKDFDVLAPLFRAYFFVAVPVNSKYKTVGEIVADARANPGKLNYGSWSVGNPVHLG